jgi:hypothetical protein
MDFTSFCAPGNFCDLVPSGLLWIMPVLMPIFLLVVLGVPIAQILHRAGHSRWWTILAFVPLLNLIGLWVFAFARWPNLDDVRSGYSGGTP